MTLALPHPGLAPAGDYSAVLRVLRWMRRNLFSSLGNTVLTLVVVAVLGMVIPPLVRWAITDASIAGSTPSACTGGGACWTFVKLRLSEFFFGHYPPDQRWRIGVIAVLLVGFGFPVVKDQVRWRFLWLLLLLTVFPALAAILLAGGVLGLPYVDTNLWGGLMLNVVVSFVTVAGSLPIGIVLALGRRSGLRIVRLLSVGFIELWRGVPLLTVLFISAVMVPLFLPNGVSIDRLIRAMAALVLFNSAYMAEVVRGGLQAVPLGQYEAADSLGLDWWKVQTFIVLPQALRMVVPGIINTVVDLFKDTTLLTIIGLFDLLGAVNQAMKDPAWLGHAKEGFAFASLVFFVCCWVMSKYGRNFERRLRRSAT